MPRIDGENVTVYNNLNVNGLIYVGGNELDDGTGGSFTDDNVTVIDGNLIITGKLYIDGVEEIAVGAPIPDGLKGTRLKNVNITSQLGVDGSPIIF